jgi:hypothetical protein
VQFIEQEFVDRDARRACGNFSSIILPGRGLFSIRATSRVANCLESDWQTTVPVFLVQPMGLIERIQNLDVNEKADLGEAGASPSTILVAVLVDADGDLTRFGFFCLGHMNFENAVAIRVVDSILLHGLR